MVFIQEKIAILTYVNKITLYLFFQVGFDNQKKGIEVCTIGTYFGTVK
jgi:hypothetical protein